MLLIGIFPIQFVETSWPATWSTTEQLMATGFLRLTATNSEAGTDDEEFRVAAVIDRVNTTWAAFQGISFACVQCHGHPYEPIPHEDYYRFMDILNNTEDCDLKEDFPRHLRANDPQQQQLATDTQLELLKLKRQQNQPGSVAMRGRNNGSNRLI